MKKLGKLAALAIAAGITSGGYFAGCTNESKSQESEYAIKLAKELEFKTELDFNYDGMTDIEYNQTIRNNNHIIGLTLDGFNVVGKYAVDYVIKSEFSVDEEFYNAFKALDKSNISELYNSSSTLIEKYTPYKVTVNDEILYEAPISTNTPTYDIVM